jgi:NAD(P)-dependent dehydrogenase (short-subunit alcohol dehydrogenase family)
VGRACARAFADDGWDVGLIARGEQRLEAARGEVEARGRRASIYAGDVADAAAVEDAAGHFERELGPIDVWVNNAMTSVFSPAREMTADEFRRVTDVTYLGFVYGTLSALRRMLPRDRGTIVQVGSALAYRGITLQSAYCGAKHAIQGFTESVRAELYHDKSNVHISMVQMPALNTPQFSWVRSRMPRKAQPVPPIYKPEVAAQAVLWAAKHRRRELVVGRSTVKVVIGNRIAPGVLDHFAVDTWDSQQYDGANEQTEDNLWSPVPGDFAAHGDFGDRARSRSTVLWVQTHMGAAALAAGAATATAAIALAWVALRVGRNDE